MGHNRKPFLVACNAAKVAHFLGAIAGLTRPDCRDIGAPVGASIACFASRQGQVSGHHMERIKSASQQYRAQGSANIRQPLREIFAQLIKRYAMIHNIRDAPQNNVWNTCGNPLVVKMLRIAFIFPLSIMERGTLFH
jgi:hypothetical protein